MLKAAVGQSDGQPDRQYSCKVDGHRVFHAVKSNDVRFKSNFRLTPCGHDSNNSNIFLLKISSTSIRRAKEGVYYGEFAFKVEVPVVVSAKPTLVPACFVPKWYEPIPIPARRQPPDAAEVYAPAVHSFVAAPACDALSNANVEGAALDSHVGQSQSDKSQVGQKRTARRNMASKPKRQRTK